MTYYKYKLITNKSKIIAADEITIDKHLITNYNHGSISCTQFLNRLACYYHMYNFMIICVLTINKASIIATTAIIISIQNEIIYSEINQSDFLII